MTVLAIVVICGLMLAIMLCIEMGYRVGRRRWACAPNMSLNVSSTIQASILGLMGLLIGFTFYSAGARFDARRNITGQEANAIGTAYLRIDLLPEDAQPQLRDDFRKYVQSRIAVFQKVPDMKAVNEELEQSSRLQKKIWQDSVPAVKNSSPATQTLVLSALNQMIDITTTQSVAAMTHLPFAVFGMLGLTVAASSALIGYLAAASAVRDWLSIIAFALVLGSVVYVILDYEYPRIGLIRVDPVDRVLNENLEKMNQH